MTLLMPVQVFSYPTTGYKLMAPPNEASKNFGAGVNTHTLIFLSGNGGLSDNGQGQTWHIEDEMVKRASQFEDVGVLISYAWTLRADKVRRRLNKFLQGQHE